MEWSYRHTHTYQHTRLLHSNWQGQHPLWKHFGHPWDEGGLANPSWLHSGSPLCDQAWMRDGCRGPKPGGFRPATDQRGAAVSQSGQRDWNSSNSFHGIKKHTPPAYREAAGDTDLRGERKGCHVRLDQILQSDLSLQLSAFAWG